MPWRTIATVESGPSGSGRRVVRLTIGNCRSLDGCQRHAVGAEMFQTGIEYDYARARCDRGVHDHLPAMRHGDSRDDAHRCLPVFLRLHRLRHAASSEERRLLRFLFLRFGAMPACPESGWSGRLLRTPGLLTASTSSESGHPSDVLLLATYDDPRPFASAVTPKRQVN
jgi:hypothetical protein